MVSRGYKVFDDVNALSKAAAEFFCSRVRQALVRHGEFNVALAGGSTPVKLYQLLAKPPYSEQIEWDKVFVYFGDERSVAPDHPDSNYHSARENLLSHVPVPESQIFRIQGEHSDSKAAADLYAKTLTRLPVGLGRCPEFDLILLGMGEDGHTASLFPGTDILQTRDKMVSAVFVEKLDSWRISLTYPAINCARELLYLVAGKNKAQVIKEVFDIPSLGRDYPIKKIESRGATHWFLDKQAASLL